MFVKRSSTKNKDKEPKEGKEKKESKEKKKDKDKEKDKKSTPKKSGPPPDLPPPPIPQEKTQDPSLSADGKQLLSLESLLILCVRRSDSRLSAQKWPTSE